MFLGEHTNRNPYTDQRKCCIHVYFREQKICIVNEEKEKCYLFGIFFGKHKINFEEIMMHVIVLN